MSSNFNDKKIIGFVYDFDHTLSPKNMQEYGLFDALKTNEKDFWKQSCNLNDNEQMDHVLSYMYVMQNMNKKITRQMFRDAGKNIKYFDGVETWFDRINEYCQSKGFIAEHYIVSAGQLEILEGCSIFDKFKRVIASEFYYKDGYANWPKIIINYTMKTQYLFRINKNLFNLSTHDKLNRAMDEGDRHITFDRMIYIGDGYSDVPAMKLVRHLGGHSIAVYTKQKSKESEDMLEELVKKERVDFICKADYKVNSELDSCVKTLIDYICGKCKYKNVNEIK